MISPMIQGFSLGISLIVAIGAQNAYVLRQGLKRNNTLVIWLICSISDSVLILLGVYGFGVLIAKYSIVISFTRWGGFIFLIAYAIKSFRNAGSDKGLESSNQKGKENLTTVILTTLAFTWLNPHVYLDTVIFLGSIGSQHIGVDRILFVVGATIASLVWFFALAYGAAKFAPILKNPGTWRVFDIGIGIAMLIIAFSLVSP